MSRGKNAPGPIAREAAAQRIPFSFNMPRKPLPGQEFRRIRARVGEGYEDATARAMTMPWWTAVTRKWPVRASKDWWVWIVRTAKLT